MAWAATTTRMPPQSRTAAPPKQATRSGGSTTGLNLMRGHGIAQNEALGRRYVDQAAEDGLAIAKRLQGADYDLDEVTPDADNWKYAPLF